MLTDAQVDFLIKIEKIILDRADLPVNGDKRVYRLSKSRSFRKILSLNCNSSNKNNNKYSYTIVYKGLRIFSVDLMSSPHTNPDGARISGNHMHIYKEGFYDQYAYELSDVFKDPKDFLTTFYDVLAYSNVINRDEIEICYQGVLFYGPNYSGKMGK